MAASAARLEEWLDHWDQHGFEYWVVEASDSGQVGDGAQVLGFTGVQTADWLERPVLNLYYRYAAERWGRGYATEGARHAVCWAQVHHPTRPVLAYTTLDNVGSQRTAVAAGLVRRPELEFELRGHRAVVFVSHWPH